PTLSVLVTLTLHDALPIWAGTRRRAIGRRRLRALAGVGAGGAGDRRASHGRSPAGAAARSRSAAAAVHRVARVGWAFDVDRSRRDRKSTRLNSSHLGISYA